jgi:capping protein beta
MDQLDFALDLMRRMPPADVENNLAGLIDLVPDLMENLLSAVDQPLKIDSDPVSGKDYLLCDYNRDGDSYRSPWSNAFDPPLEAGYDGTFPSDKLRELEVKANEVFDVYRDLYYEGGVSSVYTWDLEDGFACVVLVKKIADGTGKRGSKGSWDSIHVIEVSKGKGGNTHYKLTSTVMLELTTNTPACGDVNLAGSLTRQQEQDHSVNEAKGLVPHVAVIGKMVEEMESRMRMQLDTIYFGKTKDIICGDLRQSVGNKTMAARQGLAMAAMNEMQNRSAGN